MTLTFDMTLKEDDIDTTLKVLVKCGGFRPMRTLALWGLENRNFRAIRNWYFLWVNWKNEIWPLFDLLFEGLRWRNSYDDETYMMRRLRWRDSDDETQMTRPRCRDLAAETQMATLRWRNSDDKTQMTRLRWRDSDDETQMTRLRWRDSDDETQMTRLK